MRPGWYYFWRFAWSTSPGTFGKTLFIGTGLSTTQISLLSSVGNVLDMIFGVVIHQFAQKSKYFAKETILAACFLLTTLFFILSSWVSSFAKENKDVILFGVDKVWVIFWLFLLITAAESIVRSGIYPIEKDIIFRHLVNSDSFGSERVFGTYGWALFHILFGVLIDAFSSSVLWIIKPFTCMVALYLIFKLSKQPVPKKVPTTPRTPDASAVTSSKRREKDYKHQDRITFMGFTLSQWGFLLLMCLNAIGKTLMHNQSFIYFRQVLGSSNTTIGISIFVGCILEAPALTYSSVLRKRFGYRALMGLGCLAFCVRLVGLTMVGPGIALVLLEMLHGVSFGFTDTAITYFTKVELADRKSIESKLNSFTKLVGVVGSVVAARFTDNYGHPVVFKSFSAIMVVGLAIFAVCVNTMTPVVHGEDAFSNKDEKLKKAD